VLRHASNRIWSRHFSFSCPANENSKCVYQESHQSPEHYLISFPITIILYGKFKINKEPY